MDYCYITYRYSGPFTGDDAYRTAYDDIGGGHPGTCQHGSPFVRTSNPTNNALSSGTWYFMACVFDGSTLTTYIDGKWSGDSSSGSLTGNTDPIIIASDTDGGTQDFDGAIDDVRYYSRALTHNEVMSLYNTANSITASEETATPEYGLQFCNGTGWTGF